MFEFLACENRKGRRKKNNHGLEDGDDGSINGEEGEVEEREKGEMR